MARALDWEKDRRNHLPKDKPNDAFNDTPQVSAPRSSKPAQLREIAREVRCLSDKLKFGDAKKLLSAARALEIRVHEWVKKSGRGTVETMSARTIIERIRSSASGRSVGVIPNRLPGPGPGAPRRRVTLAGAKIKKWKGKRKGGAR